MSEFFKPKQNRVSIFQDWNIVQPRMKQGRKGPEQKSKPEQVRRAQQLLNDAELLHSNVSSFLILKADLLDRIFTYKNKVSSLLEEVYQLNNSKNKNLSESDSITLRIKQILQELYRCQRAGRSLEDYISHYFQNANLANYDPRIHQLKGSKPGPQVQQELIARLELIQLNCRNLFRSLHYLDKLDPVFSKEENFQYCYMALQELISHDSLVKIHALMICQLNEVEEERNALITTNRSVESEYLKYQLVYDCLELMKSEREQMLKEMGLLEKDFDDVTKYVPLDGKGLFDYNHLKMQQANNRQTMQKIVESEQLVQANIKVYRTNLQNFTRVSAQTSLYCYSYRESLFSETLTQFQRFFAAWKNNLTILTFFYQRRNALLQFKDQQTVKQGFNEADRQYIISLYKQVQQKKVGNNKRLDFYQRNILTDLEKQLKQRGIPYTVRQVQPQQIKTLLYKEDQFFQNFAKVQTRDKIGFLKNNKSNINILLFQLQQLVSQGLIGQPKSQAALHTYSSALSFCRIIASGEHYADQLRQFQNLANQGKRYQGLPKGVTQFLLSYVHDLNIILKSQKERENIHLTNMERFGQAIQGELKEKKRGKIDQLVENNIYRLGQHWANLYAYYYRLISPYGEQLFLDQLMAIALQVGQRIKIALATVKQVPEINFRNMRVEQSMFYTYKVLLALMELTSQRKAQQQIDKFRIVNLQQVLEETFKYLQLSFLQKSINAKPTQLIKLGLIQNFLSKVYKDCDYTRIIHKLRHQIYLQIVSELYVENFQAQAIKNNWLQPLLKIQQSMNDTHFIGSQLKSKKIVDLFKQILPEVKKLPLTISFRHDTHDVYKFVLALQLEFYIQELKSIADRDYYGIWEAGQAWIALKVIDQSFVLTERPFEAYENIIIQKKRDINMTLQQLRQKIAPQLSKIGERQSLTRHFADPHTPIDLKKGIFKLIPPY